MTRQPLTSHLKSRHDVKPGYDTRNISRVRHAAILSRQNYLNKINKPIILKAQTRCTAQNPTLTGTTVVYITSSHSYLDTV